MTYERDFRKVVVIWGNLARFVPIVGANCGPITQGQA